MTEGVRLTYCVINHQKLAACVSTKYLRGNVGAFLYFGKVRWSFFIGKSSNKGQLVHFLSSSFSSFIAGHVILCVQNVFPGSQ